MCGHDCPASTPKPINTWWHDIWWHGWRLKLTCDLHMVRMCPLSFIMFRSFGILHYSLNGKKTNVLNGAPQLALLVAVGVSMWSVNEILLTELWSQMEICAEKRFLGRNCMLKDYGQKGYYMYWFVQGEGICSGGGGNWWEEMCIPSGSEDNEGFLEVVQKCYAKNQMFFWGGVSECLRLAGGVGTEFWGRWSNCHWWFLHEARDQDKVDGEAGLNGGFTWSALKTWNLNSVNRWEHPERRSQECCHRNPWRAQRKRWWRVRTEVMLLSSARDKISKLVDCTTCNSS